MTEKYIRDWNAFQSNHARRKEQVARYLAEESAADKAQARRSMREAIESGKSKSEISRALGISRKTVYVYLEEPAGLERYVAAEATAALPDYAEALGEGRYRVTAPSGEAHVYDFNQTRKGKPGFDFVPMQEDKREFWAWWAPLQEEAFKAFSEAEV